MYIADNGNTGAAWLRDSPRMCSTGRTGPTPTAPPEAAEQRLLADMGPDDDVRAMAEVPLAAASLLTGLDAAQAVVVAAHLQAHCLAAGEALFAEGDAGDRLCLVSQGSVSTAQVKQHGHWGAVKRRAPPHRR